MSNTENPFDSARRVADWYHQTAKLIGPEEIFWAIIAEHQDALNVGREGEEQRTFDQAAASLQWRVMCEWDV